MSEIPEHGREPVPGLPDYLPAGEHMLWQGKPDWFEFAVRVLHVRKVAIYFAAMLAFRVYGNPDVGSHTVYILLAGLGLGLILLLARWMVKSTLYTITNRRVVMRFGIALPLSLNLPFAGIDVVQLRRRGGNRADIVVGSYSKTAQRLSYLVLWPHARPWSTSPAQPMMRCLPEPERVADILSQAIRTHADTENVRLAVAPKDAAAARGKSAHTAEPEDHGIGFPRAPLVGVAALLLFALVSVAVVRFTSEPPAGADLDRAVASVQLRFEDRSDGTVVVYDATSGDLLAELLPGTNNFLRATLRGLVRGRNAMQLADHSAFGLYQIDNGRLILRDSITGNEVDLWAFGETNATAFAKFLQQPSQASLATQDGTTNQVLASHEQERTQ